MAEGKQVEVVFILELIFQNNYNYNTTISVKRPSQHWFIKNRKGFDITDDTKGFCVPKVAG